MRDCGIDEDDFNSGEDEEEGDGVGSLHSSKKKKIIPKIVEDKVYMQQNLINKHLSYK